MPRFLLRSAGPFGFAQNKPHGRWLLLRNPSLLRKRYPLKQRASHRNSPEKLQDTRLQDTEKSQGTTPKRGAKVGSRMRSDLGGPQEVVPQGSLRDPTIWSLVIVSCLSLVPCVLVSLRLILFLFAYGN